MDNRYYYDYEQKCYKKKKRKGTLLKGVSVILCAFMIFAYVIVGIWFFDKHVKKIDTNGNIALVTNDEDSTHKTNQKNMDTYDSSAVGKIGGKAAVINNKDKEEKDNIEKETEATSENEELSSEELSSEELSSEELSSEENDADEMTSEESSEEEIETKAELKQSKVSDVIVSDVTKVVKTAMPSIVSITNNFTEYDSWYDADVPNESTASGIIVSKTEKEILIVTNAHVVENSEELTIHFINEVEASAYIKGTNAEYDIAVLSVFIEDVGDDIFDDISIAVLGDSDSLQVGEPAIVIGDSLGYGQAVTTGIISAVNRQFTNLEENQSDCKYIQTDAAINRGDSGGALLNARGEVVGINMGKMADGTIEGMGYAIPITSATPIIQELMDNETRKKVAAEDRVLLGVTGNDVTEEVSEKYDIPTGLYVTAVIEDSSAEKGGITKGDIIVSIDNQKVSGMTTLQNILAYYKNGEKINVTIMQHQGKKYVEKTVEVVLKQK